MATSLTAACTDSSTNEQTQDYTSFVIKNNIEHYVFYNLTSGYYDKNDTCHLIGKHGDVGVGETSQEFKLDDNQIDTMFLFFNVGKNTRSIFRIETPLVIQPNNNNIFTITNFNHYGVDSSWFIYPH
jgi:hypothetical protein